jgi:hypothetical protein
MPEQNEVSEPGIIKTPVTYEPQSKTIYQCGGYGVIAKVDEYTHGWDSDGSIGKDEYSELCDEVGYHIAAALNQDSARVQALEKRIVGLERLAKFIISKGTGHLGGCQCDPCLIFDEADQALAADKGGA